MIPMKTIHLKLLNRSQLNQTRVRMTNAILLPKDQLMCGPLLTRTMGQEQKKKEPLLTIKKSGALRQAAPAKEQHKERKE